MQCACRPEVKGLKHLLVFLKQEISLNYKWGLFSNTVLVTFILGNVYFCSFRMGKRPETLCFLIQHSV